jgi:hypothetical protein
LATPELKGTPGNLEANAIIVVSHDNFFNDSIPQSSGTI